MIITPHEIANGLYTWFTCVALPQRGSQCRTVHQTSCIQKERTFTSHFPVVEEQRGQRGPSSARRRELSGLILMRNGRAIRSN